MADILLWSTSSCTQTYTQSPLFFTHPLSTILSFFPFFLSLLFLTNTFPEPQYFPPQRVMNHLFSFWLLLPICIIESLLCRMYTLLKFTHFRYDHYIDVYSEDCDQNPEIDQFLSLRNGQKDLCGVVTEHLFCPYCTARTITCV